MKDSYGRTIDYLRISVTDRCNERCIYCMPEEGVPQVRHEDILTYDEICTVVRAAASLGFRKFRLTGGEPLVRKGLPALVRKIKAVPGTESVTLTTNGILLAGQMEELADAGIDGINISLDTADPELYHAVTRTGSLPDVLAGIDAVLAYPAVTCKIDCVLLGMQGQKLTDVAAFAGERPIHVRFIEMMPIGIGKDYTEFSFLSREEAMAVIEKEFGKLEKTNAVLGSGPAEYYSLPGFCGKIGFISAVTHKFCGSCNRVRLTSQGFLKTCLQYSSGTDLRGPVRSGITEEGLAALIRTAVGEKPGGHSFFAPVIDGEESENMNGIGG